MCETAPEMSSWPRTWVYFLWFQIGLTNHMIVFHLHLCLHQFHRRDNGCLGGKNCLYRNPKKKTLLCGHFGFWNFKSQLEYWGRIYTPPLSWLTVNFPLHIIVKTLKHKPTYLLGLKIEDVLKISFVKKSSMSTCVRPAEAPAMVIEEIESACGSCLRTWWDIEFV